MNALDVFRAYAQDGERMAELEEKIRRREAVAAGGTRPVAQDGGGRSSRDASMRLLDYVDNVEQLRTDLERVRGAREADRACALYLTEMLPDPLGDVLSRVHLEGRSVKEAAKDMGYSTSHVRRLLKEAETMCRAIQIISWDRKHVPVLAMPDGRGR